VTPDCQRSGPEFESGIPHSLLNGARNYDCVSKTSLRWEASLPEPKKNKKKSFLRGVSCRLSSGCVLQVVLQRCPLEVSSRGVLRECLQGLSSGGVLQGVLPDPPGHPPKCPLGCPLGESSRVSTKVFSGVFSQKICKNFTLFSTCFL
jgi:hypothetical protein